MKHLKSYRLFEFVETESNTPTLYKDNNIEVNRIEYRDKDKINIILDEIFKEI